MGKRHNRFDVMCLLEDEQQLQYYGFNVLREVRRNEDIVVFRLNGFEFDSLMETLLVNGISTYGFMSYRKVRGSGYRMSLRKDGSIGYIKSKIKHEIVSRHPL
jgi:hypothetical protein